jgi:hypothetical protein
LPMQRKYADPPPQFADIGRWCGFFMSLRGVALGVSAVQHDMKREETVEEVEKNTEWERHTPKRNVVSSSLAGGAKTTAVSRFFVVYSGFCCRFFWAATLRRRNGLYMFRCIPANWPQTVFRTGLTPAQENPAW